MKRDTWIYRCRCVVMCLMVVIGLVLSSPSPAQAQKPTFAVDLFPPNMAKALEDMAGFAEVLELLGNILSLASQVLNLITDGFNAVFGALFDTLHGILGAKIIDAEIETDMVNYVINSNMQDKITANKMAFVAAHAVPLNTHLCRQTIIRQGASSAQELVDGVAHIITDAYLSEQRGLGQDQAGPSGVMKANELRCLNKYGNPIDGYPATCYNLDTKVGPFKRTLVDADILPSTLDGAVTLELPKMDHVQYQSADGQTMVATIANPQNDEQRMWLAATNYCLQLAGPKPTPPAGKAALTSVGLATTGMYRSALAAGSSLVNQCGRVVGYYTRPNEDMAVARENGNKVCRSSIGAAGKTNYLDEKTIKEKFYDCKQGMSKYQLDYMDHLVCKSPQYYMLSAHSGVLTPNMMKDAVSCGLGWVGWELSTATLQGSLVEVVSGHMKNRKTFNKIQAAMRGVGRSAANENGASSYHPAAVEKRHQKSSQKKTATKASSVLAPKNNRRGVPVLADEVLLPEVVAQ
ncbi:MAG: hypothetical protein PHD48_08760 [Alphaproteobacteria bacterium]|nr:hypothetical protein [Alphaproteobacteria bacterium]